MNDAQQVRIGLSGEWGVGSGEPEHLALRLPLDRQAIDAREKLPVEMRRLAPVQDGGCDVAR